VVHANHVEEVESVKSRQNVTVQLDKELIQKARVVAAKRGTSISGLLARELEKIVGEDEGYEAARRSALAFLEQGFHLGARKVNRDELHER
jgi:hypothetical protein